LDRDPGLYAVWNSAIKMAKGKYITNLNVDDRIKYNCYEIFSKYLDESKDVDLVYSGYFSTDKKNETYDFFKRKNQIDIPDYSIENMILPLPNFYPMWRKSVHQKIGYFDETYKIAGDWEFWLRMAKQNLISKKLSGMYGLYYRNPNGLSTNGSYKRVCLHNAERRRIFEAFKDLWGLDYKEFKKRLAFLYRKTLKNYK